jgi:hypothetical protein
MARKTEDEMQVLLNAAGKQATQRTLRGMRILKRETANTLDYWYVIGGVDYPGKARWCRTTVAGNDAAQVAEITAALAA